MSLDMSDEIAKILESITPHERDILTKKFGITFSQNSSLEVLEAQMQLTREQIESMEKKALRKLRNKGDADGQSMDTALPLVELLRALTSGSCSRELWERGAVAHYGSPEVEAARGELVRAAISAGEWHWPDVPLALGEEAKSLLALSAEWKW